MNILYDDNMPYAEHFFPELGNARAFSAGHLGPQDLADCEALLVRSTSKVDKTLLDQAPKLKFVATATAGFNHLDLNALKQRNITWYAAGGCNARAVAEYVISTLFTLAEKEQFQLSRKTIAIVGVGNVGSTLSKLLNALALKVIEYDPPRALRDSDFTSASFEDVLNADVISLHVPLVNTDEVPKAHHTYHLLGENELNKLKPSQIVINACRGEVLDNEALLALANEKSQSSTKLPELLPTFVLDCWENEPYINKALLPYVRYATAHIAGHSLEGKANGTEMVYQALCQFLKQAPKTRLVDFLPAYSVDTELLAFLAQPKNRYANQTIVANCIKSLYDIENDDSFFRHHMAKSETFSAIRQNYPIRREWPAATIKIKANSAGEQVANILEKLGFSLFYDTQQAQ
uniref:4-phosphoerythronate dehydrogenase n=1 Tax=Ningiella ruwaisensis TaxID=2364274 RepID=UPI00109F7A11|nr:4-phosphoerythronate dehydrogenase [Ningiella ruwaisensis]